MGEKSREFVAINSIESIEFFRSPSRLSLKMNGNRYILNIYLENGEIFKIELDFNFTALCPDRYGEGMLLIVDSKSSVEIIENYGS